MIPQVQQYERPWTLADAPLSTPSRVAWRADFWLPPEFDHLLAEVQPHQTLVMRRNLKDLLEPAHQAPHLTAAVTADRAEPADLELANAVERPARVVVDDLQMFAPVGAGDANILVPAMHPHPISVR